MRRLLAALIMVLPLGAVAAFSGAPSTTTPTTASLSSSPNPSIFGQAFTATVTISPTPADGGTVAFTDNGTSLIGCTQPVTSGQAGCVINLLNAGIHTIVATYQGDAAFAPSGASVVQTINPAPSGLTLSPSADPSAVGQPVTFSAVSPAATRPCCPTGTVVFSDNGSPLSGCTAAALLNGVATCTVTYSAEGVHSIVASYSGDANFTATSVALGQTVAHCGAALTRCDLGGANLAGANLAGADLTRADLRNANLAGTNLSAADLKGATLNRADLSGANLAGANLNNATVFMVTWSNTVCPDGTNSDADGITCVGHLAL